MSLYARPENVENDLETIKALLHQDERPSFDDIKNHFGGCEIQYFHYLLFLAQRDLMNDLRAGKEFPNVHSK